MTKSARDAARAIVNDVARLEAGLKALLDAKHLLANNSYDHYEHEFSRIITGYNALIGRRYRDLCMFGLGLGADDRERIRAIAFNKTLAGYAAPTWFDGSLDEWNELAFKMFAPKYVKEFKAAADVAERLEGETK